MRFAACAVFFVLAGCASGAAPDQRVARFEQSMGAFIERLRADPNAPPGFVVVAVDAERTLFEHAYGVRDLANGAPMTLDTPVYNASVTKAYTGLLAAMLDAEGVLRLDESLSDVWPDLTLPAPMDSSGITVAEMLSHTNEMSAGGLVFRSVATGEISAAEVPAHLARFARPNDPAFEYTNQGPFVVSAMMEARTGVEWRDLVQARVFAPLEMSRTSARLETWPASEVAHGHTRFNGAWRALPHKPTATLNAAGGMYASGRDSARFLQLFMSEGRSADGRIPASVLRRTWAQQSVQDRNFWEFRRDGYGLGWDLGAYDGHRFVARSGGYAGFRSFIVFLPEENFGIVVLSAAETGGNPFNFVLARQAIDFWLDVPDAAARADANVAYIAQATAGEAARADAAQAAWAVRRPLDARLIRETAGVYENERLGRATVSPDRDGLSLRMGVYAAEVRPAGDGYVVLQTDTVQATTFAFVRNAGGRVEAILIDDDRYDRVR